jgi:lysozyme
MKFERKHIAALSASALLLVSLANFEGYRSKAYIPVPGDVPTIGYGTTDGVKMGDTVTKAEAMVLLRKDVAGFEGVVKRCVKVPLYQYEYDAYTSLAYNVGARAFCKSTLVRKLNAGDYAGACAQILRWDRFKGRVLRGLTNRRRVEYGQCMGVL